MTIVIQGATKGTGAGSTGWEWDPEPGAAAINLWTESGLIGHAYSRHAGQEASAVGDVHVFIVTRPCDQKMETVYCRSF